MHINLWTVCTYLVLLEILKPHNIHVSTRRPEVLKEFRDVGITTCFNNRKVWKAKSFKYSNRTFTLCLICCTCIRGFTPLMLLMFNNIKTISVSIVLLWGAIICHDTMMKVTFKKTWSIILEGTLTLKLMWYWNSA